MELLHDLWRWDTDSTNEQGCFLINNHVNEIVELSYYKVSLEPARQWHKNTHPLCNHSLSCERFRPLEGGEDRHQRVRQGGSACP
jgi:hypothetical protein